MRLCEWNRTEPGDRNKAGAEKNIIWMGEMWDKIVIIIICKYVVAQQQRQH